jgi:ubiquinone/menaquinone biosynthesis C-methylase UbiE
VLCLVGTTGGIVLGIEAEYYDQYSGVTPEEHVRKTQLENPKQLERTTKIARHIPTDVQSVLDVRCGGGVALNLISQMRPDLKLVGLERSVKTANVARTLFGLTVVEGSADALPFKDNEFDVVMANEILEHLPWSIYEKTLVELARVAKRTILVTTPYEERRHFVTCPKCTCSFSPFYHVRSFSDGDLAELFPGFVRTSQALVWVKGRAPLLYEARRLKAAMGLIPALPQHTICPQCGFRNEPNKVTASQGHGPQTVSPPPKLMGLVTNLWGLLPRRKRAKWAIVSYTAR